MKKSMPTHWISYGFHFDLSEYPESVVCHRNSGIPTYQSTQSGMYSHSILTIGF